MKTERLPSSPKSLRTMFINKLAAALPMLIFMILYFILFHFLETRDVPSYFYPSMQIDQEIPFVPCFIIPYFSWFLWIPAVVVYLLITDEEEYHRTSRILIAGMTIFLLLSYLFPTKLSLRPPVLPDQDFFCRAAALLYQADTPTNVFPSIHVYNTCAALGAVFHGRGNLFKNRYFQIFSMILSLLICLSTLLVKQHSLADVLGAFLMYGLVLQFIAYRTHHTPQIPRKFHALSLRSAGLPGEYRRKR